MRKVSFKDRLRYAFDNSLSRGPIALIGWLGLISLAIVLFAAIVLIITGIAPEGAENSYGFFEAFWVSLMRTLDPGTGADDTGWRFRILMFMMTIGGIFIVSALIGVLTSGLEEKLVELRKGRSVVIEKGHTLILGWSAHVFPIISELVIANSNVDKPRIVILADKDKVEMEDEIRAQIKDTGKTKVICRSGSPIDLNDLEIVSPHRAKSIIILSPHSENPDAEVIKTILAITNNPNRRLKAYHIVAEIREEKNVEVAKLVGRHEAQLVVADDVISKITVQTSMQAGLSVVLTELMDFDGDEIYMQEEPKLVGKKFSAALMAYKECSVIGIRTRDGKVMVKPPFDTEIKTGDKIIAVAEDDDKVIYSGMKEHRIKEEFIRTGTSSPKEIGRTLILGWNRRAAAMIRELDNYVPEGSQLMVVADSPDITTELNRIAANVKNQEIFFQPGDTTDRKLLDSLNLPSYKHVILLCYADLYSQQEADARTLMTLLHLRDIEQKQGEAFSVVSEMLDIRNRALAEVTKVDDFIVSDKLTSLLLTQISENKDLMPVFEDLFDAEGSEIYLKPVTDYVITKQPVNFYTVVEAARRRNEIAIGYRLMAQASDPKKAYGVKVNPNKKDVIAYNDDDKIIVIAED